MLCCSANRHLRRKGTVWTEESTVSTSGRKKAEGSHGVLEYIPWAPVANAILEYIMSVISLGLQWKYHFLVPYGYNIIKIQKNSKGDGRCVVLIVARPWAISCRKRGPQVGHKSGNV